MIRFYTLVGFKDGNPVFDMGGTAHRKICSYRSLAIARAQREFYRNWLGDVNIRILRTTLDPDGAVSWVKDDEDE
jgi:hypothetical protein